MVRFADVSDVETIWGSPITGADRARVQARIEQATAEIQERDPLVGGLTIDERMAARPSFALVVRGVVVDMVHRVLMNPEGRLEVGVDDARVRFDASVSTGQMYLSDTEFRKLFGGRNSTSAKAFTITPGPGPVFQQWG